MKGFLSKTALLLLLTLGLSASAEDLREVRLTIKGMVCSFCATGLKKTLTADKNVRKVAVNLDTKTVTVMVDPASPPSDERLRELVKDAGYEVASIDRAAQGGASP